MLSNGLCRGWLDAKERCPAGCQSWVRTTFSNAGAIRLMTGTTSSPPGTARAPPMNPFCTSTTMSAASASTVMTPDCAVKGRAPPAICRSELRRQCEIVTARRLHGQEVIAVEVVVVLKIALVREVVDFQFDGVVIEESIESTRIDRVLPGNRRG